MLIFLDFDGVLHPRVGTPPFQPACMQPLAEALAPFEVDIVVASSWREMSQSVYVEKLRQCLQTFTDDWSKGKFIRGLAAPDGGEQQMYVITVESKMVEVAHDRWPLCVAGLWPLSTISGTASFP